MPADRPRQRNRFDILNLLESHIRPPPFPRRIRAVPDRFHSAPPEIFYLVPAIFQKSAGILTNFLYIIIALRCGRGSAWNGSADYPPPRDGRANPLRPGSYRQQPPVSPDLHAPQRIFPPAGNWSGFPHLHFCGMSGITRRDFNSKSLPFHRYTAYMAARCCLLRPPGSPPCFRASARPNRSMAGGGLRGPYICGGLRPEGGTVGARPGSRYPDPLPVMPALPVSEGTAVLETGWPATGTSMGSWLRTARGKGRRSRRRLPGDCGTPSSTSV